jgi:hypothetical protein
MKAEHRKELHTNVLADRMGRLVQGMKSGPGATSAGVWIIGAFVLGIAVAWYFARGSMASQARAWVELNNANDSSTLKRIGLDNPGTLPARTARFQQARLLLRQGLQHVYGFTRAEALTQLEEAAKLYSELVAECSGHALLQQEALMGAAKAEEARLIGISKQDEPDQFETQYHRALDLYQRLAREYPKSYLGEAAAKRVREMTDERGKVTDFYADLNKSNKPPAASAGGLTNN